MYKIEVYTEKNAIESKPFFSKSMYNHGFKSICYRISNIFIGSCSIFLWINSIHAFGKKCFWFNSNFFPVYKRCIYLMTSYFETIIKWYLNFERFYSRNYDWSMYALPQPMTLVTNDMLMLGDECDRIPAYIGSSKFNIIESVIKKKRLTDSQP